jgi:serine/threonine-protein kinase
MTLGRYELLLPVGVGGMACVWAARLSGHRAFSKLVAIKTVLPHLSSQSDFENMALDEARVAAGVHHPNVCNLFDVGEERGVLYLVFEWVNGDSLLHLLRQSDTRASSPVEYGVAARIVADACAGLHAAHELCDAQGQLLGVVHRDVSPHNVLVSLDGTTKIADFGVVKAEGQLHQTTRTGEIRGKLAYMAPEQLDGSPIDRRADIFAMGCVLYHATTGQAPFRGENDVRLIRAVMDGTYVPPEELAPDYPADLAAIARCALAPRPEERFETADAMRGALETWLKALAADDTSHERRVITTRDVGQVVRERIGAKLERRQEDVRAALEAERVPEVTRPTLVAGARDSGVLRSVPPPGPRLDPEVPLLPPASPVPALAPEAPPRRPLKMTLAVTMGLLVAVVILQIRALLVHGGDEHAARLVPSEMPLPAHAELAAVPAETPLGPPAAEPSKPPADTTKPVVAADPPKGRAAPAPAPVPANGAPEGIPTTRLPISWPPQAPPSPRAGAARTSELPANPY